MKPPFPLLESRALIEACKRVVALLLAVLLLPVGQPDLFAQQYNSYNEQYPPAQAAPYGQQPYSPQPYYPQPYRQQQPYSPQPYYPQPYRQQQPYYPQPYYPQPSRQQQPYAQQQPYPAYGQAQIQPLNAQQLEQLVAPIALYPDPLVAQVLTASTYPEQVSDADRWRQAQGYALAEQIAAGADAQNWDPSVKALTDFPQVLAQMDRNLRWTTDLGNAYYNQPQDILEAVQGMRQRAQAAGNLQSTPQETVSYDQGNIELAPANPQVVYVPAYNPWTVYGQPVSPFPGFFPLGDLGSFLGSTVSFGLGVAVDAFSRLSFGWLGWGLSWLTDAVLFHQANYFSRSTSVADWGFAHGGGRAFSQSGTMSRGSNGFDRGRGGYGQPRRGYNSAYGNGFNRSPQGYGPPREGFGRGFETPRLGSPRPAEQTYNRLQPSLSGGQQYGRLAYGSGLYGSRPAAPYAGLQQTYRPPAASFTNRGFGRMPSGAFGAKGFSGGKAPHFGGFHPFGGGHSSQGFGGGHSGGGHSGGGGHWFGKHHR